MIHHVASAVPSLSTSFPSVLLAAAGRAWARTRPRRVPFSGSVRGRANESETRPQGGQPVQGRKSAFARNADAAGPSTPLVRQLAVDDRSVGDIMTTGGPLPCLPAQRAKPGHAGAPQEDEACARAAGTPRGRPAKGRPPRWPVWRNPWSTPVTELEADAVSEGDAAASDRGRDPSGCTTDPPWTEIAEALSASGSRPCWVHYGPFESPPAASVPPPTSSPELVQRLVFLRTLTPPPSLEWLIRYHARFRLHQSAASFNLLLTLAIRMARRGTAKALFMQMARARIDANLRTRQLRVRFMVRFGDWQGAWAEQQEVSREQGEPLPLAVWLEFFGTEKRGAMRTWERSGEGGQHELRPTRPVDPDTLQSRYRVLMANMPSRTPDELARIPTSVVYRAVHHLISTGQPKLAFTATESFLRELPDPLEANLHDRCLAIIHLHLSRAPRGRKGHFALRRLLYQFLHMHRDLRPDATTLFLLMRPLLRARGGGSEAEALVKTFVRRWGGSVVDDKVRRRLAAVLCAQNRLGHAAAVVAAQTAVDVARQELRAEQAVVAGPALGGRVAASRAYGFGRRNGERWKWRLLRRRLRRKTLQRRAQGRASRRP